MLCSIEGCFKPVIARGWCWKHWARWKRNGDPLLIHNAPFGEGEDLEKKRAGQARYRVRHREALRLYSQTQKAKAYQKLYRETHKKETAARGKKWKADNPGRLKGSLVKRRALLGENPYPVQPEAWIALLKTYAFRCAYCGQRCVLEQDHVIPLSNGGKHSIQNLVPSCRHCNAVKYIGLPLANVKLLLF